LATFFSSHAGTEAVGAGAFDSTGLECTFHGKSYSSSGRKKEGGFYIVYGRLAIKNQKIDFNTGNKSSSKQLTSYPQIAHSAFFKNFSF
jgi:hypothetical protein